MPSTSGTGNQATLTWASYDGRIRRIGGLVETLEALDDSDLSTTNYEESLPADLIVLEPQDYDIFFDPNDPPTFDGAGAITVTWPDWTGSATPMTLGGSGFLVQRTWGDLANNELNLGGFQIKWDGKTEPTVTAGSDT
jgi:hypothetical protein